MLTEAQIALNRKSASNLAKRDLGLDTLDVSAWSFDQRAAYNKALAAYIKKYPASFNAQDVATAEAVSQKAYGELADAAFSFGDFAAETVNNANDLVGKPLVNLGQSVSSAFNALGMVGPWLAVGGVLFVGYMFFRAKGAQVSK